MSGLLKSKKLATLEERTLEFNIVSAVDLKKAKTFGKQSCFVVAYVNPAQKQLTKVDRTGGRNPSWNSKLIVTCDERLFSKSGSYVTVEIYSYGRITNKLLGTVTIPLNEVTRDGKSGATKPQVLGYQVRRRSGKIQGVLNMSARLGEKKTISTLPAPRCYGEAQQAGYGAGLAYRLSPVHPRQAQYNSYSYGSPQRYYSYSGPQGLQQYGYGGQQQWRSSP